MLQKRYLRLFAVLCMAMLFAGCACEQRPLETGPSEETLHSAALNYDDSELGFSLAFPEEWSGRAEMRQEENTVIINVDGADVYFFASVENREGAAEKELALMEAGYEYYLQNGTHFFYYKISGTITKDMCPPYWGSRSVQWCTENWVETLFQIPKETAVCRMEMSENGGPVFQMKTPVYTDYRLGFTFTIPEKFFNREDLRAYMYQHAISLNLVDEEDIYLLCKFVAVPTEDPVNGCIYSIAEYPELMYEDGKVYGGINYRRPEWVPGYYYAPHGWETYPEEIRNLFSFEEVQEMVDSFTLLDGRRTVKSLRSVISMVTAYPMYIGGPSLERLDAFLAGYLYRNEKADDHCLDGFSEFVAQKYEVDSGQEWASIIQSFSSSEQEAFDKFKELFEEYQQVRQVLLHRRIYKNF